MSVKLIIVTLALSCVVYEGTQVRGHSGLTRFLYNSHGEVIKPGGHGSVLTPMVLSSINKSDFNSKKCQWQI